jgi:hypothetical protein
MELEVNNVYLTNIYFTGYVISLSVKQNEKSIDSLYFVTEWISLDQNSAEFIATCEMHMRMLTYHNTLN